MYQAVDIPPNIAHQRYSAKKTSSSLDTLQYDYYFSLQMLVLVQPSPFIKPLCSRQNLRNIIIWDRENIIHNNMELIETIRTQERMLILWRCTLNHQQVKKQVRTSSCLVLLNSFTAAFLLPLVVERVLQGHLASLSVAFVERYRATWHALSSRPAWSLLSLAYSHHLVSILQTRMCSASQHPLPMVGAVTSNVEYISNRTPQEHKHAIPRAYQRGNLLSSPVLLQTPVYGMLTRLICLVP